MALLNPKISVLDETDSGLDVDALKIVSEGVNNLKIKKCCSCNHSLSKIIGLYKTRHCPYNVRR